MSMTKSRSACTPSTTPSRHERREGRSCASKKYLPANPDHGSEGLACDFSNRCACTQPRSRAIEGARSGSAWSRSLVLFADTFAIPPSGIVAVREYGSSSPPAASLGLGENHPGSCPGSSLSFVPGNKTEIPEARRALDKASRLCYGLDFG